MRNPPFESFEGGIWKEWGGKLSVNGTVEGVIALKAR